MSVRRRLVVLTAGAVAAAVVVASVAVYILVRATLRGQVDDSLRRMALVAPPVGPGQTFYAALPGGDLGGVVARGEVLSAAAPPPTTTLHDAEIDGTHVRVLTTAGPGDDVLQLARPLTEVDASLRRLLWILLAIGVGGVALAGGFGLRLGTRFSAMLGALEDSRAAQRQLVADASHELRTPLTSVLTNVEHLARGGPDSERALAAATDQLHELDTLIEDLVDLARPEPPTHAIEDVRLDVVVADEVERAERHAPAVRFDVQAEPALVRGVRPRLHRAVGNLLANAVRHGPPQGPVHVRVSANGVAELIVDDHGPGIAPVDRVHAFDRFWRSDEARALPGSGLGLAIVRHVAETHGGSVAADDAPGGGARLRLRLPLSRTS